MKLDRSQIERFLKQPDPRFAAVLIYGPDSGMVRERGSQLTRQVAGSLDDPFRVAEFMADGDYMQMKPESTAILPSFRGYIPPQWEIENRKHGLLVRPLTGQAEGYVFPRLQK